jgi:hypothetical protein
MKIMKYDYVIKSDDSALKFNKKGFSKEELHPGEDVADVKFFRCSLKAGCNVSPVLDSNKIVILVFNGKEGYVTTGDELLRISKPAFFAPDFDRTPYTVHAVEDIEFIMGVFGMNKWDMEFYKDWHLRFPFFSLYSDGVQYDQDCKLPGTKSWSIIQPFQIGHISIGVVRAVGGGTNEKGHRILHQWNYCLGNSDFELTVDDDDPIPQKPGDWSFISAGRDHKLLAAPGKEVFYVWIEYFVDEDIQKYYLAQIFNGSINEVK